MKRNRLLIILLLVLSLVAASCGRDDEGTTEAGCCNGAHGGRIATILAGDGARRSATYDQAVDHYSTLATIESVLGLSKLGDGRSAPALTTLVTGAARSAARPERR